MFLLYDFFDVELGVFCLFSHKIKHLSEADDLFLPVRVAQNVNILPVILRLSEGWSKHQALLALRAVGNYWVFVFRNVHHEPETFQDLQPLQKFLSILLQLLNSSTLICIFCPSNLDLEAVVLVLTKKYRVRLLVVFLLLTFLFSHGGSR